MLRSDVNAAPGVRQVGQVDPAARAAGVADARQEAFQRSMSSLLGKPLLAQVLARLTDGNFLVKVEGNPVRMMLPPGTQVGSEMPMTLLAAGARPTFQLAGGNGQALAATLYTPPPMYTAAALSPKTQPAQAEALPGKPGASPASAAASSAAGAAPLAALLPGAAPAPEAAAGPAPVLSAAARLISSVLAAADKGPPATRALAGGEPLTGAGAPDPAQLAQRLQHAIAQSGLFYESHLAEWAEGSRSMADLMREPQAAKAPGTPPTEPGTAQLINQQLTSHEQARVAWQGQLAPGQQMQWEIHRDAPERRGGRDRGEDAPAWRSGMRFRLPRLGEIDATIVMVGERFQVEIQAATGGIGGVLRAHAGALTAAMEAAGTPLASLSIGVARAEAQDG